jgi:histone deacetylase complex regulatory component SIN3
MRELRVEDALLYLDQVKVEFGDRPHIYNEFLDIMKTFKTQQIDTPGVIRRVSNLFQGNKKLVLGFNTFLPEGYKIELPLDGDGPPVAVFRAPGETITHILSGPGAPIDPPTYSTHASAPDYGRAATTSTHSAAAPSAPGLAPSPPKNGAPSQQRQPPQGGAARGVLPTHTQPQLPASQQPLRGPPLAHSQIGQPQRGPAAMGKKPTPGLDQAAAASSPYQQHPQGGLSQPTAFGQQGLRGAPPGPAQRQMLFAENAVRARLEQQARGPGPAIPGRLPHQPPAGARAAGIPPGATQLSPDGKTPAAPRLAAGAPSQLHAAAAPPRQQLGLQQQNQHAMQQQQQAPQPQQAPSAQAEDPQLPPLEFDHAINYVTTIKKRFSDEPETYKKFLEILHTYQKEQRGIKEVLEEVSTLFADHPDLLKEFTYFLPDGVQGQAKAQLEQVAKEAEARKRAASSKQAIMQQAQGMQRQAQQQVTATQQQQRAPPPLPPAPVAVQVQAPVPPPPPRETPLSSLHLTPPAPPIPFGATQGRSRERERELYRTAVYGVVSFLPVRPPRKKALTVAQAAAKNGRPSMLPTLPRQPSTAETAFFERAKRHLNRKELAPDKPTGQRRHTPYIEFLKCLHLFGAGVLNKDELVLLLRGLFMQGHAPKSGVNAGGGASNPTIANDAQELLREFEEVSVGNLCFGFVGLK